MHSIHRHEVRSLTYYISNKEDYSNYVINIYLENCSIYGLPDLCPETLTTCGEWCDFTLFLLFLWLDKVFCIYIYITDL